MFTDITYQDWLGTSEDARRQLLPKIINLYKESTEFRTALQASVYFRAENEAVSRKKTMQPQAFETKIKTDGHEQTRKGVRVVEIEGNRVYSNFFFRLVTQQNQHLLANGVTIGNETDRLQGHDVKARLGLGFDTTMQQIGEKALIQGVGWGLWNHDHVEIIEAVKDAMSGFVALVDEETSAPRVGVQFWQIAADRPMYVRLYEEDGLTVLRTDKDVDGLVEVSAKRPYVLRVYSDALGDEVISGNNYGALPLIPLYANPEKRSELTNALKSKIDAYDRISSDFVDNLDRANDVYWVLNNFGGNTAEICEMIEQINKLRVVANISDGVGGGSTAEPHAFEVPYEARKTALELLEAAAVKDFMGLSLDEITGGSLTNVAIRAALTNLNLKCDRYEWQCFAFVQQLLRLIGVETELISFVRQDLVNQSEVVQDIATMAEYLDDQTKLELNPYITAEQIPAILERLAAERYAGAARLPPEEVTDDGSGDEDGGEDRADDA